MSRVFFPIGANEAAGANATRPPWRYLAMLASVLLLMLTGTVAVLLASTPTAIVKKGDAFATFGKHASWVTIAVVALLFVLNRDYRTWRRWAPALVASATFSLLLVQFVGRTSGGSKRWLDFGLFNVQPSELAKFALVIGVASFLDQRRYFLDRLDRVTVPISIWVAIVCGLIYIQRDLSTALIIGIIALGMMWAAGVPVKHLAPLIGVGVLLGSFLILSESYRRARVVAFFNPSDDIEGSSWQVTQGLLSLARGGLKGTGLGGGHAEWGWVPAADTDFVFAVVGEQLGFMGALPVVILLGTFIVAGFRTAQGAPDVFGSLLAAGISIWFLVQMTVNLLGVLGSLPITGVTLPFISYGGTSLILNAIAAGLLLNIARQST